LTLQELKQFIYIILYKYVVNLRLTEPTYLCNLLVSCACNNKASSKAPLVVQCGSLILVLN